MGWNLGTGSASSMPLAKAHTMLLIFTPVSRLALLLSWKRLLEVHQVIIASTSAKLYTKNLHFI